MTINGKRVEPTWCFIYDGCHKIYICESAEDSREAMEMDMTLHPMSELPEVWRNSCSLRFISNFSLTKEYVKQFERARFYGFARGKGK